MIPLYTANQFKKSKSKDKLKCKCYYCSNSFYTTKGEIVRSIKGENAAKFCSKECGYKNKIIKKNNFTCDLCSKPFKRLSSQMRSKRNKFFCSRSCAAKYNNAHKKIGTRRSKLETWLESKLISLYPDQKILFNDKTTINSELDIYFPNLKLAFELNGIFHYEPIYGKDKLDKIQNNDSRKFQACLEKEIGLCIIDVSEFKNFKEQKAKKYLDIINNIILNVLN